MTALRRLEAALDGLSSDGIGIGRLVRVAWFSANYQLAARQIKPLDPPAPLPMGMPDRATLVRALFGLLREDRANVRAGLYPPPDDAIPTPAQWLRQARAFFADLPSVDARRRTETGNRDLRQMPPADAGDLSGLPAYYTQNFHFQTDGYLSARSAALYDYQIDVLFSGGTDAMRRLCLPPLVDNLARRGLRAPLVLDLACGTGRTGRFVKQRWPSARLVPADLSLPYLAAARTNLAGMGRVHPVCANAERLPFADASFDAVTCVFTFHELPPKIRRIVAAEVGRVLRPGGRFVLVDSLQTGDAPPLDALLEAFPRLYHEPFFQSYLKTDLSGLLARSGLVPAGTHIGFLAKRVVGDKPA
ncbi:MAG: methyltransferase domain-containing protein [Alphaproteobacteria bacterium]